jgi:hypothetical protein
MSITRFETQELGIGAISLRMVEPELEGDKVVDLVFTALWVRSGAKFTFFLQLFLFSFVWFSFPMEATLDGRLTIPLPHVQYPK